MPGSTTVGHTCPLHPPILEPITRPTLWNAAICSYMPHPSKEGDHNHSSHVLRTSYVPRTSPVFIQIHTTVLCGREYYSHFIDDQTG